MSAWRSHPLQAGDTPSALAEPRDPQKNKQKEVVSHDSETTEGVKEQGHVSQEEMEKVHAVQDKQDKISMGQIKTCSQASDQNLSSETDPDGWLVVDLGSPPPKNEQLMQQRRKKDEEISHLKQEPTDDEKSGLWFPWWRGTSSPVKDFTIKFRTSGKTGGCEQKFLEEVSNLLSEQSISLKVEASTETSSKDLLLLVFCPIASRMGTDIQNALEGLHGEQKAILVVMHFIPPDNTGTFLDTRQQGTHPALVLTVHTRYTLQDGFYPCEMNQRAMDDVADAIKKLNEDTLREDSGALTSTLFNMSWGGVIMGVAYYSRLCLSFYFLNRTPVPPLQAPASTLALDPPVQSPPLKVSCRGQGRPLDNQEEPGGGLYPDAPRQEGPGTMSAWRSHPLQAGDTPSALAEPRDPQKTKQKEVVSHDSETTEGVKEQGHVSQEEMEKVHAVQDKQDKISRGQIKTCSQASDQNLSSETDPDGWLVVDLGSPPPKNEQLMQQRRKKDEEISHLKQEPTDDEKSGLWFPWWRGTSSPVKDFTIKFRTSGKTGGCEQKFLEEVSNLLSEQSISLKVEASTETSSKDLLLLVFCPIASRMGTDIQNALEGLHGEQKAILVVMHFIPPDNTGTFLDTSRQGTHPAVMLTVHTRYTLQNGFYPCKMNATAVADVADAIKGFDEDTLREDSGASRVLLV